MFDNDTDIKTTVTVVDKASSAFKNIANSIGGLSKAVFAGIAGWDLLKKGSQEAVGFMEDSIKSFIDAQKQVDLTRSTIESMGMAYATAKPKLEAFGTTLASVAADNETANLAAAQLAKLAGGDLTRGMGLAKLAADLTASGYNDFATNVDNLTRVLSGKGQRALLDYRVNLDENATTAQQLDAIIGKVTQTTDTFGETLPGQINKLTVAFDQAKQTIGEGFVIAVTNAISPSDAFGKSIDLISGAAKAASIAMLSITSGISMFAGIAKNAGGEIGTSFAGILHSLGLISDSAMQSDLDKMNDAWADVGKNFMNAVDPIDAYNDALKKSEDAQDAATESNKKAVDAAKAAAEATAAGIANANAVADSLKKLKGKYDDFASALTKVRQTAVDELASITKAHTDATETSMAHLNDLKNSLDDLSKAYNKTAADAAKAFASQQAQDTSSVADSVVAEQKKIQDLKNQVGLETDPHQKVLLAQQLKVEEDAYAGQADFIASIQAEVDAAKKKASETDFERAVDDYKTKRAAAAQEYADNRADAAAEYAAKQGEINAEILQEQTKMKIETEAYTKAYNNIVDIITQANLMQVDIAKKSTDQIIALIDAQITKYNNLADAIARASQGKPTQIQQVSTNALPIREHGGIVPGPVGAAIPIIAHGQERVIPASGASKGGMASPYYQITINNPQVGNAAALAEFEKSLNKTLRDLTRVHKLNTL